MSLVYSSQKARRDAARLLPPGAVLENEIERAILSGHVYAAQTGGYVFDPERRWVAHVTRRPGRLRERPRQWLVVALERHREADHGEPPPVQDKEEGYETADE